MGQSTNRLLTKSYCDAVERASGYLTTPVGLNFETLFPQPIPGDTYTDENLIKTLRDNLKNILNWKGESGIEELYINEINLDLITGNITTKFKPVTSENDIPIYILRDNNGTRDILGFSLGVDKTKYFLLNNIMRVYGFQGIGIKFTPKKSKYREDILGNTYFTLFKHKYSDNKELVVNLNIWQGYSKLIVKNENMIINVDGLPSAYINCYYNNISY